MEAWVPGCHHHCSFPSPCLASPHLKSVWPSRRRNHGGGQGPLSTTTIALPSWKGKSSGATATPNSHWHKFVSPQHRSLQPHTEVCRTAYINLGRRWAAVGGGWGGGSPGLPGSQPASGQNRKGGRSALGHQVFTVGQVPPAVIPWCQ